MAVDISIDSGQDLGRVQTSKMWRSGRFKVGEWTTPAVHLLSSIVTETAIEIGYEP